MRSLRPLLASLLFLALLAPAACDDSSGASAGGGSGGSGGEEEPLPTVGVRAIFDPTFADRFDAAATWLAFPWPSDLRRNSGGRVKLSDFPNPNGLGLLDKYGQVAEERLDGFSVAGAVHVAFDAPLDLTSLPTDPALYVSATAPLQLVDVTDGSSERGRRRPLRYEYRQESGIYVPAHSLAVGPSWGFPLKEKTTYALLVTTGLKGEDGNPARPSALSRWVLADAEGPAPLPLDAALLSKLRAQYEPVRRLLAEEGTAPSSVIVATVFTTQDVTGELRAIRAQVKAAPAPAYDPGGWHTPEGAPDGSLTRELAANWSSTGVTHYKVMEGRYASPNYQEGEVPYAEQGGRLHDSPVRSEELRFVLSIPDEPAPGRPCLSIVQYAHGTGGDAYSFLRDGTAGRLAARGLAGISLDQPLHGPRGEGKSFDVDRMSFNFLNPEAARGAFRQSAIDTFVLTRFVREQLRVEAAISPTGQELCFDPERVGFMGHSHGGLSGALVAAYEDDIAAYVLSGAGGGLSITLLERKDIADIQDLVTLLLGLGPDEPLSELHPVVSLVQTLTDITDPLGYSPHWLDREVKPSLLVTSGEHDEATPFRTAAAMALGAGVPLVEPVAVVAAGYELAGFEPISAPVSGNFGGSTAGFLQWTDDLPGEDMDTHFLVFHRPEAIHASMRFLQSSALEGTAVIERDPGADVQ